MRFIIGAIALGAGIMLLIWGHNTANAPLSQVKNLVTGTPTDRAMYFYIGGAAAIVYGLLNLAYKKK